MSAFIIQHQTRFILDTRQDITAGIRSGVQLYMVRDIYIRHGMADIIIQAFRLLGSACNFSLVLLGDLVMVGEIYF
jgi:hypothetical protein